MNEADSRFLAEQATAHGYAIVPRAEEAHVLVLNTCTVRDSAEQRAYGRLGHFKSMKDADPDLKIVVCGCLAEQDRDRLLQRLPHVDALFGTHELKRMSEQLARWSAELGEEELVPTRALLDPLGGQADGIVDAFTHLRAYVNVQYGCSYYCTYCIVPHVRGRFEHRPVGEILAETERRIAAGAREITLVGQTVNAYEDLAAGLDFAGLLRTVAAVSGLDRLGFITSHPKNVTPELIAALAEIPQMSPRFHLALQSGSDPVLKKMNRKYTIGQYFEKIEAFRAACPDWALTTDIITGFPGETSDDFALTVDVIERGYFAQVYSFAYSPRRGTPAAQWAQVPPEVGLERLKTLNLSVNRHVEAYHQRKLGTTVRALVQGPSRKDPQRLAAKTGDNVTVIVPIDGDAQRFAQTPWLDIRIDKAQVWGCTGELLSVARNVGAPAEPIPAPTKNAAYPLIDLLAS